MEITDEEYDYATYILLACFTLIQHVYNSIYTPIEPE